MGEFAESAGGPGVYLEVGWKGRGLQIERRKIVKPGDMMG